MNNFLKLLLIILGVLVGGLWWFFGPVTNKSLPEVFVVPEKKEEFNVALKLKEQNLIRHAGAFHLLLNLSGKEKAFLSGGFRLNKNMNAWQVLKKITSKPDLVWVVIPEGLRKEQVGEILAEALNWSDKERQLWNEVYTISKDEYIEGVYFPDTYLIPLDESGYEIAQRFINHFNERFALYLDKFLQKNIRWTTGLKIASLIQREAAGPEDMALISGIIWNRLEKGMKLEIDATLQYLRGKINSDWWGKVDIADKEVDSVYNTYKYKGLPPHPICSPGLAAIEAALNPQETDCLYYLHDQNRQIHCARTYEEHKENIRKFL